MAVISNDELAKIRQGATKDFHPNYPKATINTALQAIEDWFEGAKSSGSSDIDTATSPYTFSNTAKKALFAYWLEHKFGKEK